MKNVHVVDGLFFVEEREGGLALVGLTKAGGQVSHLRVPDGVTELAEYALVPFASAEDTADVVKAMLYHGAKLSNTELRVLTLPRSVVKVTTYAFFCCEWLSRILVDEGSPVFTSKKDSLCSRDGKTLLYYPHGREVVCYLLPDGITEIADGAFLGARVEEAVLPESLVRIGKRAFAESAIATLHVPEGVREIGEEAFMDCGQLYRATLPATLTALGDRAFRNCEALRELALPDGLTRLPTFLLGGCRALTRVTLPDGLTSIADGAFFCCDKLEELTVPGSVEEIGHGAFFLCARLRLCLPARLAAKQKDFLHAGMTTVEVY